MDEEPKLRVRIGTIEDLDEVMPIVLMACEENAFATPSVTKLLYDVYSALMLHEGVIGIIGEKGEPIRAGILLRMGEMWYSNDRVLEERAIFVHPDFRASRGGPAARLCEFAIHMSEQLGIPLVTGVLSNNRTEAKVRMYSRIMGKPSGAYWIVGASTLDEHNLAA